MTDWMSLNPKITITTATMHRKPLHRHVTPIGNQIFSSRLDSGTGFHIAASHLSRPSSPHFSMWTRNSYIYSHLLKGTIKYRPIIHLRFGCGGRFLYWTHFQNTTGGFVTVHQQSNLGSQSRIRTIDLQKSEANNCNCSYAQETVT